MDFNFGNQEHCGKETRRYLYAMGGLALFILISTYIYQYHYLPGKAYKRQGEVAAVNRVHPPRTQVAGFAAAPGGMGMNVAAPGVSPVIGANATPPGGHQGDGRSRMVCSSCHQVNGATGATVAFTNEPMMRQVDNIVRNDFAAVVKGLKGSVVNINTVQVAVVNNRTVPPADGKPHFADPFSGTSVESVGSGVVVSPNGYIVTNSHVVKNSAGLSVTVFSDMGPKRYRGEVVKLDETIDLALLKISPDGILKPARLGDSRQVQVTDSVITIGSPFGLDQTVSRGVVSGLRRAVVIDRVTHDQLIQTDAAINQGNSGGAMVNRNGDVIGINTAIYTPTGAFSGIGFAIPINKVKGFIQEMIQPDPQAMNPGAVTAQRAAWGNSGVTGQNIAATQGPPIRSNAAVPGSHLDGRDKMSCATCHKIIGGVRLQGNPAPSMQSPAGLNIAATAQQVYFEGALIESLDPMLVERISAQVRDGAFVASVYPETAAAKAGLLAGDIIFKVNGRWVLTAEDLLQRANEYKVGDNLRLSVYSGTERRNLYLLLTGQMQQAGNLVNGGGSGNQPQGLMTELIWLGMELKPLTAALVAKNPMLAGKSGALISDVEQNSVAEQAGLQKGDLVKRINGMPVNTIGELERVINASDTRQGVLFLLERSGREVYLTARQ